MPDLDRCQRCNLPIGGEGFMLHLEARPPETRTLDVRLCEVCLGSFRRWLLRQSRASDEAEAPGSRPRSVSGVADAKGRRAARGARSPYATALDRGSSLVHIRLYLATAGVIAGMFATVGLIFYVLSRN